MLMSKPRKMGMPGTCNQTSELPVKVFLRLRKHLPNEEQDNCIIISANKVEIENPRNLSEQLSYTFDRVFCPLKTQAQVCEEMMAVVETVFKGQNASIFAYGQTGSGKTFTMNGTKELPGVIPHTIRRLLHLMGSQSTIEVSFLEIYNERIYDLLLTERYPSTGLDLREQADKSIAVAGLSCIAINTYEEYAKMHDKAMAQRSTASTKLNEYSSRSHFILQIIVKTKLKDTMLTGKLHLIDLAGSENNKLTGNHGTTRMAESGAINKSLFVLGQVVEALNKGLSRIPYRNSKITRFLQDSLGGKANALMVACIAPGSSHALDTYGTLNFATKSKMIKNKIITNETATYQRPTETFKKKVSLEGKENKPLQIGDLPLGKPLKKNSLFETKFLNTKMHALSIQHSKNDNVQFREDRKKMESMVSIEVERRLQSILSAQMLSPMLKKKNILNETLLKRVEGLEKKLNKRVIHDTDSEWEEDAPLLSDHNSQIVNEISLEMSLDNPLKELQKRVELDILFTLNTGTKRQIMNKVKGIGIKRAALILDYRDMNGEFQEFQDLKRIGLSDTQLSQILRSNLTLIP